MATPALIFLFQLWDPGFFILLSRQGHILPNLLLYLVSWNLQCFPVLTILCFLYLPLGFYSFLLSPDHYLPVYCLLTITYDCTPYVSFSKLRGIGTAWYLVLSLPCYQESLSILKCMWSFRVRCTHDWDSSTNCCLQIQPHPTSVMQHFWEVKAACWICQGWVKSLSEIYLFLF